MSEPAKEQVKKLWLWCGLKEISGEWRYAEFKTTNRWWQFPSGKKYLYLPPVDLNTLSRWAVPKVFEKGFWMQLLGDDILGWDVRIHHLASNDNYSIYQHKELTLALFWAVSQIIEKEEKDA